MVRITLASEHGARSKVAPTSTRFMKRLGDEVEAFDAKGLIQLRKEHYDIFG